VTSLRQFGLAAAFALAALLGSLASASAQDMSALWDTATHAWLAGDRAQAIRTWEQLREAGVRDPDLEYDLGTAYGETGHLGRAVWHFETALSLRPGDEDARMGLDAARTAIGRRLAQRRGEATVLTRPPMGEAMVAPFSERLLAALAVAFDALLFLILVVRRYVRGENARVGLAVAAPLVALLLCADLWGLGVKRGVFEHGATAIVLDDGPLSEGPDPRAQARGDVTEGERARVLGAEADFLHIELGGDRHGWIGKDHIGQL